MTRNEVRTLFITRFSDGRNKFRHRKEVEHCIRSDGEEIRNFLHRLKEGVDKGWPDDIVGVALLTRMLNAPHKLGKEDKDLLITR